jgi:hypothetical protein
VVECLNSNIGRASRRQELDGVPWDRRGIRPRIAVIITLVVIGLDECWSSWMNAGPAGRVAFLVGLLVGRIVGVKVWVGLLLG